MAKWGELPEHVLVEILLKLPVKSLIRLSCVSKKLCAFIKNSDFTFLYSKNNKPDILLVVRDVESENHNLISFYSLTTEDDSLTLTQMSTDLRIPFQDVPGLYLIGPCNGLICLSDIHDKVVLCNPILQEFKLLPPTTFSCPRGLVLEVMGLGLGFDPCTNDYKLVRIVQIYCPGMITDDDDEDEDEVENEDEEKDEEGMKAEVYDVGTNLWRKIEAQVPYFFCYPSSEFFYKGCCHICAQKTTICFNISSETFTTINYPQSILDSGETLECLTVLDDCLALVSYVYDMVEPTLIDIWVMKEYGNKESWVKQFTIGPILVQRPLSSWRYNFILFEGKNKQLICCELDTNKVTKFEIYCHHKHAMEAIIYRESLVSILH